MKKMIKLSLVAATAVAGLTTTASASTMEEAIKDSSVSGYVRYRYTNGEGNALDQNEYRMSVGTKTKVNDKVTAHVGLTVKGTTNDTSGDASVPVNVSKAYFTMKMGPATVIAGKQALATPFADPTDQQGTGVVALVPAGPVTLAAGYFINSDAKSIYSTALGNASSGNDIGGNNIAAVAAIAKVGPANVSLWYADVAEESLNTSDTTGTNGALEAAKAGAKAYNANVTLKAGPATVEVNHASVDYSANAAATTVMTGLSTKPLNPKQTRIVASVKAGPATVTAGYVKTGKEGGDVTLGDTDAKSNFALENMTASDTTDANIYYLGAKAKIAGATVGLAHARTSDIDGTDGVDTKYNETKLCVGYNMSKNFKISAFMTKSSSDVAAKDKEDTNRIEIKYTF